MGVYLYTQCPRSPVRVLCADRQQAKCGVSLRPLLALMTILSQSLLTLVRRDLVSLLFLTVWHIRL